MEWTHEHGKELERVRLADRRSKRECAIMLDKSAQTWANWEKAESPPDAAQILMIETKVFPQLGEGYFARIGKGGIVNKIPLAQSRAPSIIQAPEQFPPEQIYNAITVLTRELMRRAEGHDGGLGQ